MSRATTSGATPRVTVVTSAYNAEAIIEPTVRSVLRQTFRDFEYVIVNDGSRDRTAEILRRMMAADPRIRVLDQDNRGLAAARNRAVRESQSPYVALLDHDDLWHPEKLALQVSLLDAHPDVAVASCYSAVIDVDGALVGWRLGGDANGDVYQEMLEWDMVSGGSVVLVRREALAAIGPSDESLPMRTDWDLWIRLARRYRFGTVPRILVGYRRSASSVSRRYERFAEAGTRVLQNVLRDDPHFQARYRYCLARDAFAVACMCAIDENPRLAWRYIGRSLRLTPAPLLAAPRRWAMIGVLTLQTALPQHAFLRLFGTLSRSWFGLAPGRPFDDQPTVR
jgi:glycosyltransferase involved in cell wall biosynthesis